ncbi:hypothetical protein SADUNF_Sadunf15G0036000 [Salix dunnii]|uniref:Acyl-[acyl-carrier-protein] hydrolase n=1 Tax=Salix dunnii TaxID=1413687 RepID=A0A835JBW5_9ROSI|nr:hypothetical protein SADUNF_Sadunf15G0036000 [Salix dunnii]
MCGSSVMLCDGFGATHGMVRNNNLVWVVTRMQIQVDEYPVENYRCVDPQSGEVGENGMRRDWLIRSDATENLVMMNQQTRGLSTMPETVSADISLSFIQKKTFQEEIPEKINKLNTNAIFTNSNSMLKRSDLDMNHHVNNVRYVNWMLETIPCKFLENCQLTRITLNSNVDNGDSLASALFQDCNHTKSLKTYTRLLQITGDEESEIARGKLCGKESSKLCN